MTPASDSLLPRGLGVALVMLATVFKLAVEQRIFRFLVDEQDPHLSALNKSALLLNDTFGVLSRVRVTFALAGGVALPALMLVATTGLATSALAVTFCLAGELIERHLFFVAEVAPKMPGGRGT